MTSPAPVSATQTFSNGVTILDTTPVQSDQAGYFASAPLTLDRETGYAIRFAVRVISETHASNDRAGFSVIALSSDTQGIELGFWKDEVWAQEGGSSPNLFTHAESATFDTTAGLVPYQLDVLGNMYALSVNSTLLLSGTLRDYTAFAGFPDVYETPNLLFLGDDTSAAQAMIELESVSIITNTAPARRTTSSGTLLTIDDLGVFDLDADGRDVALALDADHGVLTVTTGLSGGVSAGDIDGNGTSSLVMTGTIGEINTTLVHASSLSYQADPGFLGTDVVTVTLTDSHDDTIADSKYIYIDVLLYSLSLDKRTSNALPYPGERITYTIVIDNASDNQVIDAVISDTLSAHLSLADTVQLDPPHAGTVGMIPHIVTGLTVTPWHQVTATLAVTVSKDLTLGTRITNTATITYRGATGPVGDQVTIVVPFRIYVPIVLVDAVY
jgi:uncharacterized repeat protein (TIGR01451 family)